MADERSPWACGATGPELQGMRRAHQYLRHLDLGEGKRAQRLLAGVLSGTPDVRGVVQLALVGQGLRAIAVEHAAAVPGGREREAVHGAELNRQLQALPRRPPDVRALMAWVVASGAHAAEVLRWRWPEQEKRLLWLGTAARVAFDAEDTSISDEHAARRRLDARPWSAHGPA